MKKFSLKGLPAETKLLLRSIPAPIAATFIVAIISMNLLANKGVQLPISWLVVDCGFIVSWLVFLTNDIVVKRFGPRAATILSVVSLLENLGICLIFYLCSLVPGMWGESYAVEGSEAIINTALDNTFGGTWYVLMGSSIAFLVSSVVNNFLNYALGKKLGKNQGFGKFAFRSFVSTFIGQFVDNMLFALIVSMNFFGWTLPQCVLCAATGAIAELLCEVIFAPIGYKVSKAWERDGVGKEYIEKYGPDVA